jgi:hypothetical protein
MGTGGSYPRGKARQGRNADHSPHLVTRSWMSRSYTSSPPLRVHKCVVGLLFCFYLFVYSKVKLSHYTPWRRLGEKRYRSYPLTTSSLDEVNAVVEWLILCPIREVAGSILGTGDRLLIEFFVVFLSPSTWIAGYYLKIRPRPLPTKSFPIHCHSLIILSSTLYSLVAERASLNKLTTIRWSIGQRHAPVALYPSWKYPWYPLVRRLCGPQSRSGHSAYQCVLHTPYMYQFTYFCRYILVPLLRSISAHLNLCSERWL